MSRRHIIIIIAVVVVIAIFVGMIFTANNMAPATDGGSTADDPATQSELPAGPATEPPVLTP